MARSDPRRLEEQSIFVFDAREDVWIIFGNTDHVLDTNASPPRTFGTHTSGSTANTMFGSNSYVVAPGRVSLARALADRGYEVLVFDYRGYGGNEGSPSEEGLALDAAAAVTALAEVATVDRLIFLGESLGAAVAARLAVESPPTALVLRSPFPSLAAVAAVHYPYLPTRLLLRDRYDTLQAVSLLKVPILVVAGSADSIVPTHLSRAVYQAASADAQWALIDNADHNDPTLSYGQPLMDTIDQFLDQEH
jgi:hypothetical protein